jgi:hypothetical protein
MLMHHGILVIGLDRSYHVSAKVLGKKLLSCLLREQCISDVLSEIPFRGIEDVLLSGVLM